MSWLHDVEQSLQALLWERFQLNILRLSEKFLLGKEWCGVGLQIQGAKAQGRKDEPGKVSGEERRLRKEWRAAALCPEAGAAPRMLFIPV